MRASRHSPCSHGKADDTVIASLRTKPVGMDLLTYSSPMPNEEYRWISPRWSLGACWGRKTKILRGANPNCSPGVVRGHSSGLRKRRRSRSVPFDDDSMNPRTKGPPPPQTDLVGLQALLSSRQG